MKTFSLAAVVVFASLPAHAISVRHDYAADQSRYTNLANQSRFAAVGALVKGTKSFDAHCSGTVIGPYTVLTAAHCVENLATTQLEGMSFILGDNVNSPLSAYRVRDYDIHPNYNNTTLENDIAVLQVYDEKNPIDRSIKTAPAQLYTATDEASNQFPIIVGYGTNGNGVSGALPVTTAGIKRAALNVVTGFTGISDDTIVYEHTSPGNILRDGLPTTFLEGNILPGDSGGGLFLSDGADWKVAGVHSYITGNNGETDFTYTQFPGSGGYKGYDVRVSQETSWIQASEYSTPTGIWPTANTPTEKHLKFIASASSSQFSSLLPVSLDNQSLSFDYAFSDPGALVDVIFGGNSIGMLNSSLQLDGTFSGVLDCTFFSSCSTPDGTRFLSSLLRPFEFLMTGTAGMSFSVDDFMIDGKVFDGFSDPSTVWTALSGGSLGLVSGDLIRSGNGGGDPSPIPVPGAFLFLFSALFLMFARRKVY